MSIVIIHQIFSLVHDCPKRVTWPNIPQLNCGCCEKYLKRDNKHNSLHLARKYARIFVLDIICSSKLAVTLSENCSFLGTDNVQGHIRACFHAKKISLNFSNPSQSFPVRCSETEKRLFYKHLIQSKNFRLMHGNKLKI